MVSDPRNDRITGEWFRPGSSAAIPAQLAVREEYGLIVDENEHELARDWLTDLNVSARIGSVVRRITFRDNSVFETTDNDGIDAMLARAGSKTGSWVHRAEAFHPRLIVFMAVGVLLVVAIYKWALPALVELAVAVTPPVVPQIMSAATLKSLDRAMFHESKLSDEAKKRLSDGFADLVEHSPPGFADYTLNFRGGGLLGPNALALPDGTLVITDELVDMANGDTELLLGVLGHEIGHVEHEHSLRQLYRAAGVAGLIMIIGGDVGSGMEDILVEGGGLLSLSFSRNAEAEADRHSVELMARAGYDPVAIARFFELIEKKLGDTGRTSMLSTHPGTPERRQAVLDHAGSLATAGDQPSADQVR